jgi:hypothetical protein
MKVTFEGNTILDLRRECRKFLDQTPAGETCPHCGWDLHSVVVTDTNDYGASSRLIQPRTVILACENPRCPSRNPAGSESGV